MKYFKQTPEQQQARASENEKINEYIKQLKAQIMEAENARDGIIVDEPLQGNRLYNFIRSIESKDKITEVTAYPKAREPKPLVRLSEAQPFDIEENRMRAPIAKKQYGKPCNMSQFTKEQLEKMEADLAECKARGLDF